MTRDMTDLRQQIEVAVQRAVAALTGHPAGDLDLGYRHAIWAALGPRGSSDGRARRTTLALLSAKHVLPSWTKAYPHDDTALRLIDLTNGVASGAVDAAAAKAALETAWGELDELEMQGGEISALSAGYAAAAALRAALHDELFDDGHLDLTVTDADVDPEWTDAAFAAAAAHAGGPLGSTTADPARRRDFWRWWLETAVPEAARDA